jgi:glycosyltransferase involved in cell wall biosynthesis
MRVLQICSKPPLPAIDGGCKAMNNITGGLLQNDIEVKVLTVSTFKHPFLLKKMDATYLKNTQIENCEIDIKVKPIAAFFNLFSKESYNVIRFFSKEFEKLIASTLQNNEYDIIFLESLFMTPYIEIIRANSNAKLVYRAHNIEHEIWERNTIEEKNSIKKQYLKLLTKRLRKYEIAVLHKVDAIASISEKDKKTLLELGSKKPISVTPFGFDLSQVSESKEIKKVVNFFHIGSMDWEPNQEGIKWFLENVWSRIIEQNATLQFNLAGKRMPQWLKEWNQKNVNIIGEVDDALEFIQENDVMVVPLFVGSGMRIKIIEGMAIGKPVIATKIAAEGICYKNGFDIVIADTIDEFVSQAEQMVENYSYTNQIGKNARKTIASNYDNKFIVNNLVQFFKQLTA